MGKKLLYRTFLTLAVTTLLLPRQFNIEVGDLELAAKHALEPCRHDPSGSLILEVGGSGLHR
jgi:hypothetical protein